MMLTKGTRDISFEVQKRVNNFFSHTAQYRYNNLFQTNYSYTSHETESKLYQSFTHSFGVTTDVLYLKPLPGRHKKRGCKIPTVRKESAHKDRGVVYKGWVCTFYFSQETGFLKGFLFCYLATYLVFLCRKLNFIQTDSSLRCAPWPVCREP